MFNKTIILAASVVISLGAFSSIASAKMSDSLKPGDVIAKKIDPCIPLIGCDVVLPPIVIGGPAIPTPPAPPAPTPAPKPSGPVVIVGGGGYFDGISCGEGRSIVRDHGFRRVRATNCSGDVFTYVAKKRGRLFTVAVNMDGDIVGVGRLMY